MSTVLLQKFCKKKMQRLLWKKEKILRAKLLMFVPGMTLLFQIISTKPVLPIHLQQAKKNYGTAKTYIRKDFLLEISMKFLSNFMEKGFLTIIWWMWMRPYN